MSTHVPGFVLKLPPPLKQQLAQVAREHQRSMQKETIIAVQRHVAKHQKKPE